MNIQEKIDIFQMSCKNLLQKEVAELNKTIDSEMEKQMKDELQEYQKKEEFVYTKKLEKMEKEYNKQMYSLEMENKKEILNQKKQIQKDLKKEVTKGLKDFVKTPEYKDFLLGRIEEVLAKLENTEYSVLRLLQEDCEKYGEEIYQKYHIKMETIEEQYIGGCILEDTVQGIYVDHTIQNSVNEKFGNELR